MERKKRNRNKRKYIRLLAIGFAFCCDVVFASPSLINMEYFPKVAHVSDSFNIKFYMDSRLNSFPKIILNDGGFLLKLVICLLKMETLLLKINIK